MRSILHLCVLGVCAAELDAAKQSEDFDGVILGECDAHLSRLGHLEGYLREMPEIEVVISSSWLEAELLEMFRKHSHVFLHNRITGIVPAPDCRYDPVERQREIEAFLETTGLNENNANWIAPANGRCSSTTVPRFWC